MISIDPYNKRKKGQKQKLVSYDNVHSNYDKILLDDEKMNDWSLFFSYRLKG
jgi:hypothetical protein